MSLQVWLPLIGDTRNQGLSQYTITTLGTLSWVTGKLGATAMRAGNGTQIVNGLQVNTNFTNLLNNDHSISVWVKPYGNHVHYNGSIMSSGNWNTANKRWAFGVSQDNSKVDVLCMNYNTYITCDVPVNEWTNLICVRQGTTVKLYKNGSYIGSRDCSSDPSFDSDANVTCIGRESYANGYFSFNGAIQDLRLYSHALSEMEIKELAKGLVLHYPLNRSGFGQENIFLNSSLMDLTSENLSTKIKYASPYIPVITDDGIKFTWSGSSAREVDLYLGDGLELDTYYTLSFIYRSNMNISSSAYLRSDNTLVGYWNQKTIPYSENWARYTYTFKPVSYQDRDVSTGNSLTLFYSGYTENKWIELKKNSIKLEKGTSITPWCPNSSDDLVTNLGLDLITEYDCSGFGNNGVLNGINEYTSDTIRYNVSRIFNGVNNPVTLPNLSTLISDGIFTFSVWFKKETDQWSSKSWETILGGPSGFEFSSKSGSTNSPVLYAYSWNKGTYNYTLDEWHHFVMVRTTSGTIFYLDGVQAFTGTAGSIPSGNYFLGAWSTITGQNYKGKMSDARIYATALSADDIKSLYENKGYIDNKGNIYGTLYEV